MENIDPEKFYNASEIHANNFFKWCHSLPTVIKWIKMDMVNWKILGATKINGILPSSSRYHIKGENLIKFIAQFEDGSLSTEPKEK